MKGFQESHYSKLTDEQICPFVGNCSSEGFSCKTCSHNPKNHKPDHYRPITNPWKTDKNPFTPRRPRNIYSTLEPLSRYFDSYEDWNP